jgi:tetratricopeptide (TPR) repeat protein
MTHNTAADRARLERLLVLRRNDPQNLHLYRDCVATALQSAAFEVVVSLAQEQLQLDGDPWAARFDWASGLIGQQDYAGALLQLEHLPQNAHQHPAVLLNRGLCHYCLAQYEQARAPLEACYAQGDRSPGLLRLLISTLHHLGLVTQALPIAQAAAPLATTQAALAGVLALLYLDADDLVKARQWARTTLQLHPGSVDGRVVQATLLIMRLQKDRARSLLEGVVAEFPETGRAWLGLAALALLDQELVHAKPYLQRSLALMPQHVGSWLVLGWTHMMSGELPEAQQVFERALALDRNFAEIHGGLAAVAALRGEGQRAQSLLDVARRLDPDCPSAMFAEAMLRAQAGDPAQAQRMVAERIASLGQGDGSPLAQLLTQAGRGRLQ